MIGISNSNSIVGARAIDESFLLRLAELRVCLLFKVIVAETNEFKQREKLLCEAFPSVAFTEREREKKEEIPIDPHAGHIKDTMKFFRGAAIRGLAESWSLLKTK